MSHYRISQFAEKSAVLDLLKDIPGELGGGYAEWMNKYRSIETSADALKKRAAAQKAFECIREEIECTLTEMGIHLPEQDSKVYEGGYTDTGTSGEESNYIQQTVNVNKEFLDLWAKFLSDMGNMSQQEVQEIVNRNETLFSVPSLIKKTLQENEYKLKDELPTGNTAQITEQGFKLTAINPKGNEVEVIIKDGKIYTHVDASDNVMTCQRQSKELSALIGKALKEQDILLKTESSGAGTGPQNETQREERPRNIQKIGNDNQLRH